MHQLECPGTNIVHEIRPTHQKKAEAEVKRTTQICTPTRSDATEQPTDNVARMIFRGIRPSLDIILVMANSTHVACQDITVEMADVMPNLTQPDDFEIGV